MTISSIELFELLSPKLGDREARSLVQFVETNSETAIERKKDVFMTKNDKIDLVERMVEVDVRIEKTRSEVIKWMFISWVGQIAVLITILSIFFKR